MCCVVVGNTITAGVYGKRELYGLARSAKSGEELSRIGTFLLPRQSANVEVVPVHVPKLG